MKDNLGWCHQCKGFLPNLHKGVCPNCGKPLYPHSISIEPLNKELVKAPKKKKTLDSFFQL